MYYAYSWIENIRTAGMPSSFEKELVYSSNGKEGFKSFIVVYNNIKYWGFSLSPDISRKLHIHHSMTHGRFGLAIHACDKVDQTLRIHGVKLLTRTRQEMAIML
jgi:hypothetical protein